MCWSPGVYMLGFDVFGLEEVFRVARVTVSVISFFSQKKHCAWFSGFPKFSHTPHIPGKGTRVIRGHCGTAITGSLPSRSQ